MVSSEKSLIFEIYKNLLFIVIYIELSSEFIIKKSQNYVNAPS